MPTHVHIGPENSTGLDEQSYAQCEYIQPAKQSALIDRIGKVDPVAVAQVRLILQFWLDIPTTGRGDSLLRPPGPPFGGLEGPDL